MASAPQPSTYASVDPPDVRAPILDTHEDEKIEDIVTVNFMICNDKDVQNDGMKTVKYDISGKTMDDMMSDVFERYFSTDKYIITRIRTIGGTVLFDDPESYDREERFLDRDNIHQCPLYVSLLEVMNEDRLIEYMRQFVTTNISEKKIVSTPCSGIFSREITYNLDKMNDEEADRIMCEVFGSSEVMYLTVDTQINPLIFYHKRYYNAFFDLLEVNVPEFKDNGDARKDVLNSIASTIIKDDPQLSIMYILFGDSTGESLYTVENHKFNGTVRQDIQNCYDEFLDNLSDA